MLVAFKVFLVLMLLGSLYLLYYIDTLSEKEKKKLGIKL